MIVVCYVHLCIYIYIIIYIYIYIRSSHGFISRSIYSIDAISIYTAYICLPTYCSYLLTYLSIQIRLYSSYILYLYTGYTTSIFTYSKNVETLTTFSGGVFCRQREPERHRRTRPLWSAPRPRFLGDFS